jgi:hypothetical protein
VRRWRTLDLLAGSRHGYLGGCRPGEASHSLMWAGCLSFSGLASGHCDWNKSRVRPLGVVGCAPPTERSDLERPQTSPSWGRFFRDLRQLSGEPMPDPSMTAAAASHFRSAATSVVGQTEKSGRATGKSALPSITDIVRQAREVRKVPILLQKSFWGGERKFLEPLMRFTRGDVRDHIVSSKIDHGPP